MHKQIREDLEERNEFLLGEMKGRKGEKKKIHELEEYLKVLEGKVVVYETMEMVAKNR